MAKRSLLSRCPSYNPSTILQCTIRIIFYDYISQHLKPTNILMHHLQSQIQHTHQYSSWQQGSTDYT